MDGRDGGGDHACSSINCGCYGELMFAYLSLVKSLTEIRVPAISGQSAGVVALNPSCVELAVHDSGKLRVTVRDGGRGFDTAKLGTVLDSGAGFGLNSLNEQLPLLGGSLDIPCRLGSGVDSIVLVPMKFLGQTNRYETYLPGG